MMGYGFMGPGMMGFGAMGPWMMRGSGSSAEAMCSAMASHIEGRLAYVKAELKVTDAQEPGTLMHCPLHDHDGQA